MWITFLDALCPLCLSASKEGGVTLQYKNLNREGGEEGVNHEWLIQQFFKHAAAVVVAKADGTVVEWKLHEAMDKAPLKLVALIRQDDKGECELVGEIGVSRCHPYKSNHRKVHLQHRSLQQRVTEQYVRGVAPTVIGIFWRFLEARIPRYKRSIPLPRYNKQAQLIFNQLSRHEQRREIAKKVRDRKVKRLRGIAANVSWQDAALLRLFEELEWLNPKLRDELIPKKAERMNDRTNNCLPFGQLSPDEVYAAIRPLMRQNGCPLLRPHILAAIFRGVRYRDPLLDALLERGCISQLQYDEVKSLLHGWDKPVLNFRILPEEVENLKVAKDLRLWVMMYHSTRRPKDSFGFRLAPPLDIASQIWLEGRRTSDDDEDTLPWWEKLKEPLLPDHETPAGVLLDEKGGNIFDCTGAQ